MVLDIHLRSQEPSVGIRCFDDNTFVNEVAHGLYGSMDITKETPILHRDIKPCNILVNSLSPLKIKVVDFGCVSGFNTTPNSFVGTRAFVAPEVYVATEEQPYDGKVDVYSTGMLMLWLLGVKLPRETPRTLLRWNAVIGSAISAKLSETSSSDLKKSLRSARRMGAFFRQRQAYNRGVFRSPMARGYVLAVASVRIARCPEHWPTASCGFATSGSN